MRDIFELYEFFVEGKDSRSSHVLLHISEPQVGDYKKGYLFAICEIQEGTVQQIQGLQQIIDDIESAYYDRKESSDEKDPFESTIEIMNRRSQDILAMDGEIHAFIGVVRGKELVFTTHGNPQAQVFYKKDADWKHIGLVNESSTPNQLFDSVTQGNVATGDYIFISTPSVANYFSSDRLEKLFLTRSPAEVTEHIERTLASLKSAQSFGGLLIYRPFEHEIPKSGKQPKHTDKGSEQSLNSFVNRQRDTEELLSPPLLGNAKKKFSGILRPSDPAYAPEPSQQTQATNYRPRKERKEPTGPMLEQVLIALGKGVFMGLTALLIFLKNIAVAIGRLLSTTAILLSNYKGRRAGIISSYTQSLSRKKQWFTRLPMISKILLFIALIFVMVFVSSMVLLRHKQATQAYAKHYTEQLQAIQDKQDAAQASLIYKDRAKALSLLQEAKQITEQLPTQTDQEKTQQERFFATIEEQLLALRQIQFVSAETIATLPAPEGITLTGFAQIDSTIIAFNKEYTDYISVDTTTGQTQIKQDQAAKQLIAASTPKEHDKIVFLTNDNGIAEYDKLAQGISKKDIRFPQEQSDIVDIIVYNRRVYSLDPINNQIYKHSQTQTGYDQGTAWIQEQGISIDNAVSFTIDGDIFVLETTGAISKFSAGKKQAFSLAALDPVLEQPTQIWTYNDVPYLYILEPKQKRIVVIDKQGTLVTQYMSDQFVSPQSMIVDYETKRIFVLDNNRILRFDIPN